MNYFKIFFLLVLLNLFVKLLFAQRNQVYITVTPSLYPDAVNKPSIVIEAGQEKSINSEKEVYHESKTAAPESKLSIGKASVVTMQGRENLTPSVAGEKTINHGEQKVEKQELPISTPSLNPK